MAVLFRLGKSARGFNVGKWYLETAKTYPATTGIVTTVIKTSAADLFAQKVLEQRENVDWRRNGVFCSFGFAYLGCWQFVLYNRVFPSWTPFLTSQLGKVGNALSLTFIDQFLHHPMLYFPAFYLFKGSMEGRPLSASLACCREDLWENCKALWTIWVPAQLINFSVVPVHLRIPFVAAVSFAWTVVLSVLRGKFQQHTDNTAQHAHAAARSVAHAAACTACAAAICTCTVAAAAT